MEPAIILADEPTGNLDRASGGDVIETIEALNRDGLTVVMVTHDPHAAAIADHIVVLVDGKVVREAPAGEADEVVELMKAVA